jgi:hypothetical protein
MTCDFVDSHEVVEQYVLGRLMGADLQAFEEHLLECPRCLDALQTMSALRDELRRQRAAILIEPSEARFGSRSKIAAIAAALVVAASLGVWRMRTARPSPSASPVAAPPATVIAKAPVAPKTSGPEASGARAAGAQVGPHAGATRTAAAPDLIALARIEPPQYIPFRVRGADDTASADFDRGMIDYANANYGEAARQLQVAQSVHPDDAATNFFLGVSLMMIDDAGAAAEALHRTIQLGDSPFRQVASLDLAKALIRQGNVDGARQELNRTIKYRGSHAAEARRLGQQLRKIAGSR